jgi:Beta protein
VRNAFDAWETSWAASLRNKRQSPGLPVDKDGALTFGGNHYVPVLKWKTAEREVIPDLQRWTHGRFTPLIEFVQTPPPSLPKKRKDGTVRAVKPKDPAERALTHVGKGLRGLEKAHFEITPFFLDPDLIGGTKLPDGEDCWTYIVRIAKSMKLHAVPVGRLSSSEERLAVVKEQAGPSGIALRVTRDDFWPRTGKRMRTVINAAASAIAPDLAERIEAFRKGWPIAHLILDLESLEGASSTMVEGLIDKIYSAVASPAAWKTLTVIGTAFPISLTGIEKKKEGLIPRTELIAWLNRRRDRAYSRMPTFGDFVIQNSEGVEPDPTKVITPYAAIRYTLPQEWLVVKGELIAEASGKQFIGLAKRLAKHKRFMKPPPHCEGCRKVLETKEDFEAVLDLSGWRHWGTVHHITLTLEQMDALPAV